MFDTLVEDFDLVEVLSLLSERCVELFDAEAAGVMLVGAGGVLQLLASSSERMRLLELFELQRDEGPCPDCYRSGEPTLATDLRDAGERWPLFAAEALRAGFRAVHAPPCASAPTRSAPSIFRATVGALSEADLRAARALADVSTLSILAHRGPSDSQLLARQLQHALRLLDHDAAVEGVVELADHQMGRAGGAMLQDGDCGHIGQGLGGD